MAISKAQTSQLYIAVFGRASEGEGNTYWQTYESTTAAADVMFHLQVVRDYFNVEEFTSEPNVRKVVETIYLNTLAKTPTDDVAGINFWVDYVVNQGNTMGNMAAALTYAATVPQNAGDAQDTFNNKVEISNHVADTIESFTGDFTQFQDYVARVNHTPASVNEAKNFVTAEVAVNISGFASHGPLSNAQVFLDSDSDGFLDWIDSDGNGLWDADEGEQWVLTDKRGSYSLTGVSPVDISEGTLVVKSFTDENGTILTSDNISGSTVENIVMKAKAASVSEGEVAMITPLTTLVEAGVRNENVLEILGLDKATLGTAEDIDINTFNPFAVGVDQIKAVAFEKVASQVYTSINTVAEAIEGVANGEIATTDIFSLAVNQMVRVIEEKVSEREVLETEVAALEVKVTAGTITEEEQATLAATQTSVSQSVVSLTDVTVIETIATETLSTVDIQLKESKAKEITALEAKVTAGTITEEEQATLVSKQATADQGILTENLAKVTTTVEVISKAVTSINEAIDMINDFSDAEAKDTLNTGAETLAAEAKAAVVAGNTENMTLSADKLIKEGATSVTDTLSVTPTTVVDDAVGDSTYGTYMVTVEGVWTYTLNNDYTDVNGLGRGATISDSFTVITSEGAETVNITIIGSNDDAVIGGVTKGDVTEDNSTITVTGTLTHTDVDNNNAANIFTDVTSATASANGYGNYTVTSGGEWAYSLDNGNTTVSALAANATATDSFTVTSEDGTPQTVTIIITGTNDAPIATADSFTLSEDSGETVLAVLGNDSDAEGDALTVIAKGTPINGGTATLVDGVLAYTPAANFSGTETIIYQIQDENGAKANATATVTVTPVNDDPSGSVTTSGITKTGQTLTAANTLADADGLGAISYQWAKDGTDISGAVSETYVLSDSDIGSTFTVTASYIDDGGTLETSTSDASIAVTEIVKLIQVRDASTLTATEASKEINSNVDYTGGSTDTIVKFDLYLTAQGLSGLDNSYQGITSGEFLMNLPSDLLDTVTAFASAEPGNAIFALDSTNWLIEHTSAGNPFQLWVPNQVTGATIFGDTETKLDEDSSTLRIPEEAKLATIYLNPKNAGDGTDIDITFQDITLGIEVGADDPVDVDFLSFTVDLL